MHVLGAPKQLVYESVFPGGFNHVLGLDDGAVIELGLYEPSSASTPESSSLPTPAESKPESASTPTPTGSRKRFTFLKHRRAGPALAVVDATPSPQSPQSKDEEDEHDQGVKLMIRLAALDEQGAELKSVNEQIVYLCVARFGTRSETAGPEDTRPWVVKVVKREATVRFLTNTVTPSC